MTEKTFSQKCKIVSEQFAMVDSIAKKKERDEKNIGNKKDIRKGFY